MSPRHIPVALPHRKSQIDYLMNLYGDALVNVDKTFLRVTQVIGDVGSGKTCTIIRFGEQLQKVAIDSRIAFQHIYLNCKIEGTSRFVLYGNMMRKVAPEISTRSLSPEEMLRQLVEYLHNKQKHALISIDEIDYFYRRSKEHLIYDFSRLTELDPGKPSPIVGEIFISRNLQFHKLLDPSEISTLGRGIVEFPRYSAEQISDILYDRIKEAFKTGVVDERVVDFISSVTARTPINGDIRVALDLLFYSGMLAENQRSEKILPDHARKVYGQTHPTITTQDILDLSETERLVLLALARSLRSRKTSFASLGQIREGYLVVCEEYQVKPHKEIEEFVQDLCDRRIVNMRSLTEFGISGLPLGDLETFLNGIIQRVRRGLGEI